MPHCPPWDLLLPPVIAGKITGVTGGSLVAQQLFAFGFSFIYELISFHIVHISHFAAFSSFSD